MSADISAARTIMVDSQVRTQDVTNLALLDAMRSAPRETLTLPGRAYQAYADNEVEYATGRWLMRPRTIGKLLQALSPKAGERGLAIAAPYGAMLLQAMGLKVTQCDPQNVPVGPFDVVVCEGAVTQTPEAWTRVLAEGGRLGVVECRSPAGRAMLYLRAGESVGARDLFDASPPIMAGFEPAVGFVF